MQPKPHGEDKEEKEFIEGMLRLLEPLLAEDWETEADAWWNLVEMEPNDKIKSDS